VLIFYSHFIPFCIREAVARATGVQGGCSHLYWNRFGVKFDQHRQDFYISGVLL